MRRRSKYRRNRRNFKRGYYKKRRNKRQSVWTSRGGIRL